MLFVMHAVLFFSRFLRVSSYSLCGRFLSLLNAWQNGSTSISRLCYCASFKRKKKTNESMDFMKYRIDLMLAGFCFGIQCGCWFSHTNMYRCFLLHLNFVISMSFTFELITNVFRFGQLFVYFYRLVKCWMRINRRTFIVRMWLEIAWVSQAKCFCLYHIR